jgi:hypothetical protein
LENLNLNCTHFLESYISFRKVPNKTCVQFFLMINLIYNLCYVNLKTFHIKKNGGIQPLNII